MDGRVLIVGQGLAGTALGLELESAGIDFAIASEGHARAASRVAAGLVNPITGQRWVKSARVDDLLPLARESYERWGRELGVALWHPLALTRLWRDAAERSAIEAKIARGDLAPYVASVSERGVALHGAAWVDLPALLAAAERRWRARGRLIERRVEAGEWQSDAAGVHWRGERFAAMIFCTGADGVGRQQFAGAPWTTAKGEMLVVRGTRLAPDHAWSRGTWLIAGAHGTARVGATYERGREDLELTADARAKLLAEAAALGGEELVCADQSAGVRLALPDRLPCAGWHPREPRVGWLGALASKGTLWAPWLARVWREVWQGERRDFPTETAVRWPHLST